MLKLRTLVVSLVALTAAGCPAPTQSAAAPTTSVLVSAGPPASASVPVATTTFEPGTYESPHCGDRKYLREVTLNADQSFTATDFVSPCPPNVSCVWSGLDQRKGRYTVAGSRVELSVEAASRGVAEFPASFMLSENAIVETSDAGSCVYSKK